MNPYKKQLEDLQGQDVEVTLNRADAADVTGKVVEVNDDGCRMHVKGEAETLRSTFTAHRDIRGVVTAEWDYDTIAA